MATVRMPSSPSRRLPKLVKLRLNDFGETAADLTPLL